MQFLFITSSEYAPRIFLRACISASMKSGMPERAMRCTMTSESIEVWKIEPFALERKAQMPALTRLPLWDSTIGPRIESTLSGCAFSETTSPWWNTGCVRSPAAQAPHMLLFEDIDHLAHIRIAVYMLAVAGGDSGRLLPAVLKL